MWSGGAFGVPLSDVDATEEVSSNNDVTFVDVTYPVAVKIFKVCFWPTRVCI